MCFVIPNVLIERIVRFFAASLVPAPAAEALFPPGLLPSGKMHYNNLIYPTAVGSVSASTHVWFWKNTPSVVLFMETNGGGVPVAPVRRAFKSLRV